MFMLLRFPLYTGHDQRRHSHAKEKKTIISKLLETKWEEKNGGSKQDTDMALKSLTRRKKRYST